MAQMRLKEMTREELLSLAIITRNALIRSEDARDTILWLCEVFEVDPRAGEDNEEEDER